MPHHDIQELRRQRDYLSARLEEVARELTRMDVLASRLTYQRRQDHAALNFIRAAHETAAAAPTIEDLFQSVLVTIVTDLGTDGAAVVSCCPESRSLAVLASVGLPADLPGPDLDETIRRADALIPMFVNRDITPSAFQSCIRHAFSFPYFLWYPFADEPDGILAVLVVNQTEDMVTRQAFSDSTLETVGALASAVQFRRESIAAAERELGEREQRIHFLAEILRTSPLSVIATDDEARITYVSPGTERLYGYAAEELIGRSPGVLNAEPNAAQLEEDILNTVRGGGVWTGEILNRRKCGEVFYIRASMYQLLDEDGRVLSLVGFQEDITEERQAEEVLRQSEEKYRDLFENANDMIQSVDPEGRLLYVNRKWLETLGYREADVPALSLMDILRPDQIPHCMQLLEEVRSGVPIHHVETVFVSRDGREVPVEGNANAHFVDGEFVATRGIFRDTTERKRMEEQLLRVQKLESLGVLAGGIAHDFNNILTGILGYISLAQAEVQPGSTVLDNLAQAESACVRATDLTQQLLTFSKGGAPVRTAMYVQELVRASVDLSLRGADITCQHSIAADLWPANVDEGQIGQVISNLVINAKQAVPRDKTIRIQALNEVVTAESGLPLPDGRYVTISVTDRGMGIPAEHVDRIFDPYFTTKQDGSGLGLATAHSIIRQHDGYMAAESEIGVGTTLRVYLPASDEAVLPTGIGAGPRADVAGRILVMDDESGVRNPASQMLERLGCQVDLACDGAEAIELYRRAMAGGRTYVAVILDLTVPGGMGGQECIRQLLELDPDCRAIVCSGYASDPIMSRFAEHGFRGVLAKPFTLADLSNALDGVVDSGGDAPDIT